MLFHFRDQFPQLNVYWDKYQPFRERVEASAKTVLLEEGKVSQNYIFIEKGCVRAFFYDHKGDDKTVQFFFENEGLASFDSFINHVPSLFNIETIEPSVIYLLAKPHVIRLIDELSAEPGFAQMMLQMTSRRQTHYMNEFVSSIRDTPEERYQLLLTERPHIIQRVPQHYIASYLGISTVHLSRIKSKLAKGNPHF
jgi:CRP-like cAMP-binding protein